MNYDRIGRGAAAIGVALVLSACTQGSDFNLFSPKNTATAGAGDTTRPNTTRVVEHDVEAPDVFQVSETGLWDGRPSLGGVWVAYSNVASPERVIIRNQTNDKFVIGALFNRERENPGPKIQVSADAASALGLLAGQPTALNVTALRKKAVPVAPPPEPVPAPAPEPQKGATVKTAETTGAPEAIDTKPIAPLASAAAAAIDKAEAKVKPKLPKMPKGDISPAATASAATAAPAASAALAATPAKPATKPATKPKPNSLKKPFIQIGIFNIEQNASNTAVSLRGTGILPTVLKQKSSGKTFWRVVVGPATSNPERATLLRKIKALGYTDAYFVTN